VARPVTVRCPFCARLNRVDLSRLADGPKCAECGRPLRLDRPVKTTELDIRQSINGAAVPVLVDFYADWCGPCRVTAPILDEFASRYAGQVLVLKLDTDHDPTAATQFGIRGIPTLVAFRDGAEAGRHVGIADFPTMQRLTGLA
jgi:thioredoxin 2